VPLPERKCKIPCIILLLKYNTWQTHFTDIRKCRPATETVYTYTMTPNASRAMFALLGTRGFRENKTQHSHIAITSRSRWRVCVFCRVAIAYRGEPYIIIVPRQGINFYIIRTAVCFECNSAIVHRHNIIRPPSSQCVFCACASRS